MTHDELRRLATRQLGSFDDFRGCSPKDILALLNTIEELKAALLATTTELAAEYASEWLPVENENIERALAMGREALAKLGHEQEKELRREI
jgi:hypothetical protein